MKALIKQQAVLQKEAYEVLEKMRLLEILHKHGEPYIVGSIALDLMTWRDIDIEVVTKDLSFENIADVVRQLILQKHTRLDFDVTDNRNWDDTRAPNGLYLGMKYFGNVEDIKTARKYGSRDEYVWQLDMHFVLQENARSYERTQKIKEQLTDETRLTILEIKDFLKRNNPKYKKSIQSTDIYNAVLDNDVKVLEGFKKYLKSIGKEW